MRRALLCKELRSLRPFLFVILTLLLLDVIDAFLTPFGARAFSQRLTSLSDELLLLQFLLGFALGSTLLVREIDDGTLNFLDGLPLTRRAIFAAKIEAALLVLAFLPAGLLLLNAALHGATRGSLDAALHPALLLTMFGLSMLVTAVALGAGMLLGFLRQLAWLVLVLAAIGVKLLQDGAPSLASLLDTSELLTLRFTGVGWQLPMATIWTQGGAALLFVLGAFALFQSAGRLRAQVGRLGKGRRAFKGIGIALMVAAGAWGAVVLVERARDDDGDDAGVTAGGANALKFTPIAGGHAATRHYSFSYPALSGARMHPLIARADRTFAEVAAILHIDGGGPIDVDLSGTTENHAGTAYLDRIRMRVGGTDAGADGDADADDADDNATNSALATLAHETTHVFATRLAGGAHAPQLENMMVFNEGLAEWVEHQLAGQAGVKDRQELAAAIVSARRLVTPRQLTDQKAFASAVDENLKYPLGAILIDSLVKRYGATAPKTLLQTLARADFPRDLDGYVLWQAAFQLAGFDLDLVLDDYARHLKLLEAKHARRIAGLPRPRGSLVEQEGEENADDDIAYAVALRFDLPLPKDATALVRFRPGKVGDSARYRSRRAEADADGTLLASVPANMITRGELCFQPGLMVDGLAVYEPWVCLPVSGASAD